MYNGNITVKSLAIIILYCLLRKERFCWKI